MSYKNGRSRMIERKLSGFLIDAPAKLEEPLPKELLSLPKYFSKKCTKASIVEMDFERYRVITYMIEATLKLEFLITENQF